MVTVEEFRSICRTEEAEHIVDNILLADDALHVSAENRDCLRNVISTKFSVDENEVKLWVIGSAKLGFSLVEKRKGGNLLPRYRKFSALSDIDVAVVSSEVFQLVWDELSIYAHGSSFMPWDSGRLGDYMVYGWLRPDHFPKCRIRRCDDWWDLFRVLSTDPRFGRRCVRGGLFYSVGHLRRYLRRAVAECIKMEQDTHENSAN